MELRHLRYFEAVAAELNFRRAAERLHVVAPALSRQIKDLEHELRVRLFDRDTTHVRLTDAGRIFLGEVRLILAHAQHAADLARDAAAGLRGRLAIGNVGPITASFMPAKLAAFRGAFPDIDVTLMEIEPGKQIAAVDHDLIQVGFTVEKSPALPPGLRCAPILQSPMSAVLGADHRLAHLARVSLKEMATEKLLCFAGQQSQTHADLVRGIFTAHGLECRPITLVTGFESLVAMIASGQGVSLMPQHIVVSEADRLGIVPLAEEADDLVFQVSAVWRDSDESPLARNFVQVLQVQPTARARTEAARRPRRRTVRPA
jgi:DNA-binding transcriptional LysR family regulator